MNKVNVIDDKIVTAVLKGNGIAATDENIKLAHLLCNIGAKGALAGVLGVMANDPKIEERSSLHILAFLDGVFDVVNAPNPKGLVSAESFAENEEEAMKVDITGLIRSLGKGGLH